MTLWAGRVGAALAPEVWEFLRANDAELLPYDCAATGEHARRLHAAGLLDAGELEEVKRRLTGIEWEAGDEDVHTLIERTLGDLGRKIHAGRSRNDQVAAAFRLYVADACVEADEAIRALAEPILDLAEEHVATLMPGYTHLQRAQPVTLAWHLLAWTEMLARDRVRLAATTRAASVSPLGAGALAGSTLGLPAPRSTIDAVADRDFALDFLYAAAVCLGHLSRIGEEIILWASAEFGFVRVPEDAATGSSMMPQKLNADVAELVRGKAGTALGRLAGLLAVVKGLPLAYNRDLQEDKEPVFAARRDLTGALSALAVLVGGLEINRERLAAAVADPLLLATDAAEALVRAGVDFRDAHETVAAQVRVGSFEPGTTAAESVAARGAPGAAEVAAARKRFSV